MKRLLLFCLFAHLAACSNNMGTSSGDSLVESGDSSSDQSESSSDSSSEPEEASFSPSDVSNLQIWLDSSVSTSLNDSSSCNGSDVSSGNQINCWIDQSDYDNHAFASGGDRPTYTGSSIQFEGAATSNNSGNCLELTSALDAQTIIIVVENIESATGHIHGLLGSSLISDYLFLSSGMGYGVSFDGTESDRGRYAVNDSAFSSYDTNTSLAGDLTSDLQILHLEFEDFQSGWTHIGCFDHSSGLTNYRGNYDLKEFMAFDRVLTGEETTQILDYLNTKWTVY